MFYIISCYIIILYTISYTTTPHNKILPDRFTPPKAKLEGGGTKSRIRFGTQIWTFICLVEYLGM